MDELPKMNWLNTHNILQCAEKTQLTVRRALQEDVMDVLRWRNDPHVCAMSRQNVPIDEAVHRNWYSQAVDDPDRLLIIAFLAGQKAGIVRFDRLQETLWEVSITLTPEARGRGLGRRLLEMALECLYVAHAPTEVLAVSRLSNEPSVRLFLSLGFNRESDDGELVHLVLFPGHGR
jgi:ribosomal protein S18 acetylase RimI-like enzyme